MTRRLSLTPYLFLAPALLVIAVFVLYPIVAVVYYSFTDYSIVTPPEWIGLKNYQQLVQDPIFWQALRHSFIYLLVTPTLIFLCILLAIVVNRKLPGINVFRALYYIPVISGSIAVGIAWRLMLDTNGLLNGILISVGILKEPVQWLAEPAYTLPIAMLLTTWMGLGYYMMIFLAGLQNISEELYDAALIDGCNAWQKHWHVSFPGLRPQITFVAVISSLAALEVFNEILILFGPLGGVLNSGVTMVFYLWRQAFRLQHAGMASAIALVLLVITLAFSIVNIRYLERGTEAG
ncbi:MAG: binding-protein-dependent transport system inner rane protein [Anaerolineales bacterium]|jgi:putative chitobiose transport system permease protein|nr:binding-protein-dependent transport system inner rane protein [Anaerolineales bacterium]